MTRPRHMPAIHDASGVTLVEILVALVVLSLGILALGRVLPQGARSELSARMDNTAGQYANEVFETLRGQARSSAALATGRHPAAGFDSLGTLRSWRRYYVVTPMAAPLDSLLMVRSVVRWNSPKPESVVISGYLMP
jgi:type IV pilus modification protein PilV